jgi:small subunit ribosomal protein S16
VISIHLRRTGAKKDPHYRVVVADSRDARDGSFIEVLGHYHPRFTPARVTLDLERIKSWVAKGAQPSDTVKSLVRQVESGKLDALPDLPKLDPMPITSMEVDDLEPVEAASGDDSEPADISPEAETLDFPVPAAAPSGEEGDGAQETSASEDAEPDKA